MGGIVIERKRRNPSMLRKCFTVGGLTRLPISMSAPPRQAVSSIAETGVLDCESAHMSDAKET